VTELHHKLGFIKFLITSEVIIKVPLAKTALTKTVPTETGFQPFKVVYQGLHHLVLYQLPPWSLDCRWMPFPYPSCSPHTWTKWLSPAEAGEIEIVVVVPKVFCLSVHVGQVLLIDSVPLGPVAHFRLANTTRRSNWVTKVEFQRLMKYCQVLNNHCVIWNCFSPFHKVLIFPALRGVFTQCHTISSWLKCCLRHSSSPVSSQASRKTAEKILRVYFLKPRHQNQ